MLLLLSSCSTSLAIAQTSRVAFDESVAVYSAEIFAALTQLRQCGDFRVLVAYVNGTDLLFVDEIVAAEGGSTYRVARSFGFVEFNHYEASRFISNVSCEHREADVLEIKGSGHDGHRNEDFEFTVSLDTRSGAYRYTDTLERQRPAELQDADHHSPG